MHQSYALATRTNPDNDQAFDLIFNIGAGGNVDDGANVRMSGAQPASLEPSSLYLMTITGRGADLAFAEPAQIASGLRNASTLAFQPESGDLWIGENGIDGLEIPIEAFSADELNVIPADQIGSGVFDFGFPDAYVDYATGKIVGDDSASVSFRPIDGSEAEGIAGIAFVPDSFPKDIAGGILAGFHGQFDLIGIENEENTVRWINPVTGEQFDFVLNNSPAVGHIDSLTATDDAIFMADFCSGSMTASTACGIIYRIAVPS